MIAIIRCGSNIASIEFALERLGKKSMVTVDPNIIESATHVILPGVGHARYAMQILAENNLLHLISRLKQPVLGICLGMQILCQFSMEGNVSCLGLLPEVVEALPKKSGLVIPHMGWNQVQIKNHSSAILNGIENKFFAYFVHSYYVPITDSTVAETEYGVDFSAILQYKNFIGMQFHPEKSGKIGEILLRNFLTQESS